MGLDTSPDRIPTGQGWGSSLPGTHDAFRQRTRDTRAEEEVSPRKQMARCSESRILSSSPHGGTIALESLTAECFDAVLRIGGNSEGGAWCA